MNSKKQMTIVVVLSSFLSMLATISGLTAAEVLGQNATASNQTQPAGQQNTTNATSTQAAAPSPMAALTQSDFEELTDNLNSAREALKDDDPAGAVGNLGSAETEVRVFMTQVGGEDSPGGQQLLTVLNNINMAQDSSGNNDTLKAFQEINTADTELLKITQKLPADGDEDD
jgi:HD-GYP domain-containing protein (c-di-GMP phosphodiesterase class II)